MLLPRTHAYTHAAASSSSRDVTTLYSVPFFKGYLQSLVRVAQARCGTSYSRRSSIEDSAEPRWISVEPVATSCTPSCPLARQTWKCHRRFELGRNLRGWTLRDRWEVTQRSTTELTSEADEFDRLSTKFFSNFFQTSIAKLSSENRLEARSSLFLLSKWFQRRINGANLRFPRSKLKLRKKGKRHLHHFLRSRESSPHWSKPRGRLEFCLQSMGPLLVRLRHVFKVGVSLAPYFQPLLPMGDIKSSFVVENFYFSSKTK